MTTSNYGGNVVRKLSTKLRVFTDDRIDLVTNAPYEYYMLRLGHESEHLVSGLGSFTIYVLDMSRDVKMACLGIAEEIQEGSVIQSEGLDAKIYVSNGTVTLLIAGTVNGTAMGTKLSHTAKQNIYKVDKPWGHELWINGQHQNYAIKQIFIKANNKTSLQFHNFKQETNILFEGNARLHFKKDAKIENLMVKADDIGVVCLSAISSIDVKPPTLHRLEAVGDIVLYEVSTAHLDDVIRVIDDTKRPDGRIEKEHGA
jgi:mannose-6-phosphate isomerase-like protein (cupin superfamily)